MSQQVILYGATGFSGRLIARLLAKRWAGTRRTLVLAGRDGSSLARLARELDVPMQVAALDDAPRLDALLGADGVTTVINAAGPFAFTATPLVKAALRNRRHYVDINGEADVYKQLDDFAYLAGRREVALVCGSGHSALTSDLMLRLALDELQARGVAELGTVRIAFSHVKYVSRGSAQTAWRSIRDQTMVVQCRTDRDGKPELALAYEPTGRIERVFDFGSGEPPRRIAMAANLLDLLSARIALADGPLRVRRVEAFIELPEGARTFVQMGTLSAPLYALPAWRRLVRTQVDLLPDGPNEKERKEDRHVVLLQIDDGAGRRLVDWRMETPDPYDFTAECVLQVVDGLHRGHRHQGWLTPAQLLDRKALLAAAPGGLLPGCRFEIRAVS